MDETNNATGKPALPRSSQRLQVAVLFTVVASFALLSLLMQVDLSQYTHTSLRQQQGKYTQTSLKQQQVKGMNEAGATVLPAREYDAQYFAGTEVCLAPRIFACMGCVLWYLGGHTVVWHNVRSDRARRFVAVSTTPLLTLDFSSERAAHQRPARDHEVQALLEKEAFVS